MRKVLGSWRTLSITAGLIGSLALVGCSNEKAAPGAGSGPGMMGGASGYHYPKLTCKAGRGLPGQAVQVILADMGMTRMMGGTAPLGSRMMLRAAPVTFPAGRIRLVATNKGWRTHELVVLPLAAGERAGQRVIGTDGKVKEAGSLGEASTSCGAGSGEGIRAGTVGWTTLTLAPGTYELICNLRNHYANGMHQQIRVTPAG